MKKLTIFTPTFNRAYCLGDLYESLCRQTSEDFKWLIIDDGSTDETKTLVESWISENRVEIEYYFKENGGMHTGYNYAYDLIDTDLNMCIDSDDYCTDNAVELIIDHWQKNGSNNHAGIIGLDSLRDGQIIGDEFPALLKETTLGDLYWIHHLKGDKKLIYRTEVVKQYGKYPEFDGEKFVPIFCIPFQIDRDYKLLTLNKILCVVEYRDDGSTKNIIRSYFNNPKGFGYSRKIRMTYSPSWLDRFRNAMHYVSSSIITKNRNFIAEAPAKILVVLAIPLGILLHLYLLYLNKKKNRK